MPRKILRRPKAGHDLKGIWKHTLHQWGEKQADKYLHELESGIFDLAENPEMGVSCEYIRKGYRRLHVNNHLIFYCQTKEHIEIIRVLHENMDTERHL